MSRRGYAQVLANDAIHQAIASVLDPHLKARRSRLATFEVVCCTSTRRTPSSMQELNFRKRAMLKHLQTTMPESNVTDLRFRVQS